MTSTWPGQFPIVLGVLVATILAVIGGALASWRAWEAASPLPTAAELTELGRLVSPDDAAPFAGADPVRDDIADTGTLVPIVRYGTSAPDPNRSIDPIRDRMRAAGWEIVEEADHTHVVVESRYRSTETYFVARKGHLRVFVIDEYWSSAGEGGGGLTAKVLREQTPLVKAAGLGGALAGAALGLALVRWGARRTRGHLLWRGALLVLLGTTVVLLVPGLAWTLYRMLPDGVTTAHNYVQEPFWRGLTGEPRAVPALYPAAVALVLLLLPMHRLTSAKALTPEPEPSGVG
ncbi:hypothetical protein [Cryptosporangium minutisporangium]|uniref:DUF1461 domain-containing protein n=1 Tax=Cryptosporangium minutisporangium TaxID=113569 RepID=A0ABP6T0Z1_9ACTN